MKLAVRAFVITLFAAGASAAVVNFHSTNHVAAALGTSQMMSAATPMPNCGPNSCPKQTTH